MIRKHVIAITLIMFFSILVYSNTFHATFHLDDASEISENPKIKDLNNLHELLNGPRGIPIATFALNYALGGLDVFGYHLVNVFIHIMNGIMVYFLICFTLSLMKGEAEFDGWPSRIPLYTSLIFIVHPVQTQAVTYIVQRMEIMASMFYLLALLSFIKGATANRPSSTIMLYAGTVLSYLLAFKSKEISITLPAVILLYDLYFISGGDKKTLIRRWPLYLILFALAVYMSTTTVAAPANAVKALSGGAFNDVSEASAGFAIKQITPLQYLYTQFNVIMTYLRLLILPLNQNLDYDYPVSRTLFELRTFISFTGILLILSAALYLYKRPVSNIAARFISFFILWFFVILSPTSSIVPIIDVIFEHRVYLPSVGFFALFATILDWICSKGAKLGRGGPNLNICTKG